MRIGDKIIHEGSNVKGEIVHMDDPRFKGKIACYDDVCVLWDNGEKITYDADYMNHFKLLTPPAQEEGSEK